MNYRLRYCLRMGCGASSDSSVCAEQELEAAIAKFPATEVEGAEEKLGMGQADKEFDTIKSFTWTFGGTGSVKIGQVQDVTLDKTPKIQLDIGECTGVLRSDNLAKANLVLKKGNIVYMHDTCESTVEVDECNCLIILKGGSNTVYTIGQGVVVAIDPGTITLNKGSGVQLRCFDPETGGLVEGEDAVKIFTSEATLTDI